jgi:hypothetical protein
LLDLSLRRGMRPEEISELLGTDPESVIVAREAALEQLASELGYYDTPELDELSARLAALPGEAWTPAPAADDEPEAADEPVAPQPKLTVVSKPPKVPSTRERPDPAKERKSRLPLLLALLAVAAVVLVIALASGGGDENTASNTPAPGAGEPSGPKPSEQKPAPKPAPDSAKLPLSPVAGTTGATGTANLVDGGKRLRLDVTGLAPGTYEVWLYDSVIDARSIGKATGSKLSLDVALPANASHFRYIDISREPADGNPNHSGESVLRVPLVKLSP